MHQTGSYPIFRRALIPKVPNSELFNGSYSPKVPYFEDFQEISELRTFEIQDLLLIKRVLSSEIYYTIKNDSTPFIHEFKHPLQGKLSSKLWCLKMRKALTQLYGDLALGLEPRTNSTNANLQVYLQISLPRIIRYI